MDTRADYRRATQVAVALFAATNGPAKTHEARSDAWVGRCEGQTLLTGSLRA